MPTYEYLCSKCGKFEVVQNITADPLRECPTCGSPVKRLISSNINIIFKGSGFYTTDYRSSSYTKKASAETESGSDAGKSGTGKSDTGKSETSKGETSSATGSRSRSSKS